MVFVTLLVSSTLRANTPMALDHQRPVTFFNHQAGVTLVGVLTLPQGGGPFPAVIQVAGSGSYPLGPNQLLMADAFAKKGIAALCYDKRGCGKSSGDYDSAHTTDFEKDAMAGFEFLRGLPEINPRKVGIIGHSEGGLIAPMAAAECPDVAFIVLLAGPGLAGDKRWTLQTVHIALSEGADAKVVQDIKDMAGEAFSMLETQKDDQKAKERLDDILRKGYARLNEVEKGQLREALEADNITLDERMVKPWYRLLLQWDPAENLRKVKCPVLALNGDKDVAVVYPENLDAIGKALKEGHNQDYTLKVFPGLNHLFRHCQTGSPLEDIGNQPTIAPEVIQFMGDWILKHMKCGYD